MTVSTFLAMAGHGLRAPHFSSNERRSMNKQRPAVLSIAIILLILTSFLFWVAVFLPVNGSNPGPPVVVYGSVVLGVLGLVAAFGLFYLKRWRMWLAIGVSVFSAFFGAGGIVYSSDAITKGLGVLLVGDRDRGPSLRASGLCGGEDAYGAVTGSEWSPAFPCSRVTHMERHGDHSLLAAGGHGRASLAATVSASTAISCEGEPPAAEPRGGDRREP